MKFQKLFLSVDVVKDTPEECVQQHTTMQTVVAPTSPAAIVIPVPGAHTTLTPVHSPSDDSMKERKVFSQPSQLHRFVNT